jgi:hypothetical protein
MQTKEYNLTLIAQFGAIRSKLADMATSCYAGEKRYIQGFKDIEDRIIAREAEGMSHQEAELKGVEEYAIECSIKSMFLKMFKTVQMKEFKFFVEWDSLKTPNGECWRDAHRSYL